MKKVIIISPIFDSLINFRGDLINEIKKKDYEVVTVSPAPSKQYLKTFKDKKIKNIPVNFERNTINPFHDLYMFLKLIQIFDPLLKKSKIQTAIFLDDEKLSSQVTE